MKANPSGVELMQRLRDASAKKAAPKQSQRFGLGTAIQKTIHSVVDVAPIADSLKKKIKSCPGCGRRVRRLDRAVPNINPFAKNLPPDDKSTTPVL